MYDDIYKIYTIYIYIPQIHYKDVIYTDVMCSKMPRYLRHRWLSSQLPQQCLLHRPTFCWFLKWISHVFESENLFIFLKKFFCFVVFFPSSWLCKCRFLRLWPFPAHLPLRYTSAFDEWGEAANPIWESKILPRLFTEFHVSIIKFRLTISIFVMYCMSFIVRCIFWSRGILGSWC